MEWSDDGVVISVRAHGETGAIVEALTRDHGRHLGLVRGGASRKVKPALQPGNRLHLHWRARLAEHLGNFSAEITREKIYLRLHDELPYAAGVQTEKWEEKKDGSVRIEQVIYVQRDGQKAIVLGKGGQAIKQIGALARTEMEQLFDRRVHLFLFVKVAEDWLESREHYRELGLDYPEE